MRVHVACPQAQLQKFLDKMVLPPDMVSTLTGKEVNDAYIGTRTLPLPTYGQPIESNLPSRERLLSRLSAFCLVVWQSIS
jgi:hypothetical protein